jgi:hypothetical protein
MASNIRRDTLLISMAKLLMEITKELPYEEDIYDLREEIDCELNYVHNEKVRCRRILNPATLNDIRSNIAILINNTINANSIIQELLRYYDINDLRGLKKEYFEDVNAWLKAVILDKDDDKEITRWRKGLTGGAIFDSNRTYHRYDRERI